MKKREKALKKISSYLEKIICGDKNIYCLSKIMNYVIHYVIEWLIRAKSKKGAPEETKSRR